MFIVIFVFLLGFYIFYMSSLHSLIILLFIEVLVLGVLFFFYISMFSWFSSLMFLLVAVCLGAYGVSLLVSVSRSKGSSYFLSL